MQDFPHRYRVEAMGEPDRAVEVSSEGAPTLRSVPPVEFGGPGGAWSPETMLLGAVSDCFVLSFAAVASASKLPWIRLVCAVEGTLDRVDRVTKFTHLTIRPVLDVPADVDEAKATRLLEKAEHVCLITNSLSAATELVAEVRRASV